MYDYFLRLGAVTILILGVIVGATNAVAQDVDKESLTESLQQVVKEEDYGKASYYAYQLAKHSYAQGDSETALKHIDSFFDYNKKAGDDLLEYLAYDLEGHIYLDQNNASKAQGSFKKSLKAAQSVGKTSYEIEALINSGIASIAQGKERRAVSTLEEALSLSIVEKDLSTRKKCYSLLVEAYEAWGKPEKVKEYQTLLSGLQNDNTESAEDESATKNTNSSSDKSLKSGRNKAGIGMDKLRQVEDSLLATRYSLEATERSLRNMEELSENQKLQIDLLNKDKQLADLEIKEQNARLKNAALVRNFIIVGILLAGALVVVLIRGYRKKIEANKEIDRQNKSIQSSINYAKRIQEAMLVNASVQESLLPESFILFKPRDSVSGDFYWFSEIKSWYDPDVVFAAVDCTGHGIPGAFMSLIGMNTLTNIVNQGEAESNQILEKLDTGIRKALQQETTGNRDGMDVALCIYRKEKNMLEFSGAKNPLIYIQGGELHQIKGDTRAIGGARPMKRKKPSPFTKHVVAIDEPTMIYVFSDGFQDQFGGPNNTKFMSKRFKELLLSIHELPLAEQKKALNDSIESWKGEGHQTDDILVMGIRLDSIDG
ncbi:SpoIIE family protein phosphatase [Fulvivirga sediminis]|uniref:SpoIIE family protein phosphatase n=1 Tax=Fulvivirga sediminis TaxID=2803949 RepID=A0A937F804_9BACT|nr:SpoIIE family protein phosphatase [Fulvivirga sediminis]MBL3656294.1 SpoIIE family protein phosphatase [Fulvivirga sediminis]